MALALLVDLPPEDLRKEVWQQLEENILIRHDGHIHAGITAGAMLLKTLLVNDRHDLIYTMATQAERPGWLYMLDQGETTIWEAWEAERAGSRLHSSFLYIGAWPIQGLAGIRPGKSAGFSEFEIKPAVNTGEFSLEWVSGRYDSEYGEIENSWKRDVDRMQLNISVPPNTRATVYMPTTNPDTVQCENGGLDPFTGLKRVSYEAPWLEIEFPAGRYHIQSELNMSKLKESQNSALRSPRYR